MSESPINDDLTDSVPRSSWWDGYQVLAIRGLLKLWEKFGTLQVWPDTGLRHIVPIYPYGVRGSVRFDLAFMMRQGHARFHAPNDNCPHAAQRYS